MLQPWDKLEFPRQYLKTTSDGKAFLCKLYELNISLGALDVKTPLSH